MTRKGLFASAILLVLLAGTSIAQQSYNDDILPFRDSEIDQDIELLNEDELSLTKLESLKDEELELLEETEDDIELEEELQEDDFDVLEDELEEAEDYILCLKKEVFSFFHFNCVLRMFQKLTQENFTGMFRQFLVFFLIFARFFFVGIC